MMNRTLGCAALILVSTFCCTIPNGRAREFLSEIERGPRPSAQIALTFDAGGEADCFADLLAALARAHVQSTFFITGKWAQENPECAREIRKHGHEVGNHTWNHLDLTRQPDVTVPSQEVEEEKAAGRRMLARRRGATRAEIGARELDVGVGTFFRTSSCISSF